MSLNEFEIIKEFFTREIKNTARFPLGIGDDAALISIPAGYELATSIDTLVEGSHFFPQTEPNDLGHKSLAISLSDLAAMGAEPGAVLLALTLPVADSHWLKSFAHDFFKLAEQYSVELIGGNITRGPLSISTVTYGWVPAGKALRRSGAKSGDNIYVTGTLGDSGLALQLLQQKSAPTAELLRRLFRPDARVQAGIALRDLASAAIDISDGLAADLSKLLEASQLGGRIHANQLPLSPALLRHCAHDQAIQLALTAGEDYELCFTAPPTAKDAIDKVFLNLDCPVHRLGTVTTTPGLIILNDQDQPMPLPNPGYQHFS